MGKKPNKKRQKSEIVITDHAVLRWLERVRGMDIDKIRDEIMDPKQRKFFKKYNLSSFKVRCEDGRRFKAVIENNKIITIK